MRHRLRSFMQTVVLSDGSSIRTPTFLDKNQPRVLLVKVDPRAQQAAAQARAQQTQQNKQAPPSQPQKQ
ncbi:Hypothetical protein NocV09_00200220 [Nannochloropsis oceanica]